MAFNSISIPDNRARNFTILIIALVLILLFISRIFIIPEKISLDYNEGWNAFQANNLTLHGNIYPEPNGLTTNNYPPLSFIAVSLIGRLVGDLIISGRLISIFSIISAGLGIYFSIRNLAPEHKGTAWIGIIIFSAFNVTIFRAYVGMNDPQWFGHALMTSGLLLLLLQGDKSHIPISTVLGSALLMVAGGLVKHNIIAIPAAATLWLVFNDRRAAILWLLVGTASLLCVAGFDKYVFNGNMLANILEFPRTYSFWRMIVHSAVVIPFIPLIIVACRLLKIRSIDRRFGLLIFGCGFSLLLGVIQGSGDGVDINAYFEALIFLSIAAPVAMSKDEKFQMTRTLRLLALPLMLLLPFGLFTMVNELRIRSTNYAETRQIIERISKIPGPVACQTLALCYWAGKQFEVDFFFANQALVKNPEIVRKALRGSARLSAVEMDLPRNAANLDPFQNLVASQYRPDFLQDNRGLYVPR